MSQSVAGSTFELRLGGCGTLGAHHAHLAGGRTCGAGTQGQAASGKAADVGFAQDMDGESVETAEKQLHAIKVALKTGQAPHTQGIKERIISHLGLEPGKSASIRAKNVLTVARRELSLSIPRGSRYNRRQCDQIMGWLKGNARPQWFAASNPNIQR